ncbi:hypothetical protein ASG29_14925 [Sphingomonas sp. Leaf412]|uniref:hypothetical protein n=1 Tax=Sphingomonas sp. Leaf412 TaxID=1736370 RepID=UPI0006FF00E2|nr:hypothetical protein [Sphingomonas sp. Leaf412]KQT31257.1 hypothetical protein ASG29_14925 [Sphingomonas sp. Leaf412]
MDSGSFSMEPISQDNLLVFASLALVAILAVLTVIGMIVGARNKRRRVAAEQEEQARIDALRADGVAVRDVVEGAPVEPAPTPAAKTADASPAPVAPPAPVPAAPVPAAPAPPPLADQPAPGMPADPAPLADEPIPAAAPLDASPATIAADPPSDVGGAAMPVTRLKGLGPKIATRLGELGITDVEQMAALTDAQAADLDAQLAPFQGRMERDRWRDQARLLAAGDRAGFEREFGKLG